MRAFSFDPTELRDLYREQGWVHIPGGADGEFLAEVQAFVANEAGSTVLEGRGIGGRMEQSAYPLPDESEFIAHLFDTISTLCGLERESMTLSERHIKAYEPDTPEEVPPHKDRLSSQASVGFSITVPAGSTLVLYPFDDRSVNPFNFSGALRESLPPDRLPEVALKGAREVVIADAPGDVMVFPGSSLWHGRRRSAGAVNLYLKFNDFNSDPLGEDPSTVSRRERTVASAQNGAIAELRPTLARRLDTITHQQTRADGVALISADVWGQPPVALTEAQLEVLRKVDGSRSVNDLAAEVDDSTVASGQVEAEIRRLASDGVIDLL
jgi:hypothetical protein